MPAPRPTPLHLVLTAALAAALVAGSATALTAASGARGRAALVAVGLALLPGLVLGAIEALALRALEPRARALWTRSSLDRFFDRRADAPREPVVALHAFAVALVFTVGVVVVATRLLLLRLRTVDNPDLLEGLASLGVGVLALLSVPLGLSLGFGLRGVFARLDAKVRLPLPASDSARRVVWLAAPVAAFSVLGLALLEKTLGPLALPLWLTLTIGVQLALLELSALQRLNGPWSASRRALWVGALALVTVAGLVTSHQLASGASTRDALDQSRPGALLARGARASTDWDRDGASALFGGRDCDGFASDRHPAARDIPGNGTDEDCDGADAKPTQALPSAPVYSGSVKKPKKFDIVWFVIDAMRADHTSLLGYERPTTPQLEKLASESLVFTRAYSQSSATMLSFPSMLTGLDPARLVWEEELGRLQLAKDQPFVWQRLAAMGYTTGFVAAEYFKNRLPGLLRDLSWVDFHNRAQRESSSSAAAMAASFIARARQKSDPYFLLVYMPAPHAPYVDHGPGYPNFPKDDRGRYDEEISNADRYMGFVLDVLRSDEKRWKNTVVIVNADHGEEFNEHGGTRHARTCHVESLHVPLVLRLPGSGTARVERDVGLIDIVPTLMELVGLEEPGPRVLDGSSLLVARDSPDSIPANRPLFCSVISQKATQGDFFRRSVHSGRWKLLREMRGSDQLTLYDVEQDPTEQNPIPLAGEARKTATELDGWLRAQLTGNLADANLMD